jgi:hypothetical protein
MESEIVVGINGLHWHDTRKRYNTRLHRMTKPRLAPKFSEGNGMRSTRAYSVPTPPKFSVLCATGRGYTVREVCSKAVRGESLPERGKDRRGEVISAMAGEDQPGSEQATGNDHAATIGEMGQLHQEARRRQKSLRHSFKDGRAVIKPSLKAYSAMRSCGGRREKFSARIAPGGFFE